MKYTEYSCHEVHVCTQNFPVTDLAGQQILSALPALIDRAKENRWDDVVANAKALDRNLRAVEGRWLKRKEEEVEEVKGPSELSWKVEGGKPIGEVKVVPGMRAGSSEPREEGMVDEMKTLEVPEDIDMEKHVQAIKKTSISPTPKNPFGSSSTPPPIITIDDSSAPTIGKMVGARSEAVPGICKIGFGTVTSESQVMDVGEVKSSSSSAPNTNLEQYSTRSDTAPPPTKRQRISETTESGILLKMQEELRRSHPSKVQRPQHPPVILPPPSCRVVDRAKSPPASFSATELKKPHPPAETEDTTRSEVPIVEIIGDVEDSLAVAASRGRSWGKGGAGNFEGNMEHSGMRGLLGFLNIVNLCSPQIMKHFSTRRLSMSSKRESSSNKSPNPPHL